MKSRIATLSLMLCLWDVSAQAACTLAARLSDNPQPTTDCPEDVTALASRMVSCIHWGGEDARGDMQRMRKISEGWGKDRCDLFLCDTRKLEEQYAQQPELKTVLGKIDKRWVSAYGEESAAACQPEEPVAPAQEIPAYPVEEPAANPPEEPATN